MVTVERCDEVIMIIEATDGKSSREYILDFMMAWRAETIEGILLKGIAIGRSYNECLVHAIKSERCPYLGRKFA